MSVRTAPPTYTDVLPCCTVPGRSAARFCSTGVNWAGELGLEQEVGAPEASVPGGVVPVQRHTLHAGVVPAQTAIPKAAAAQKGRVPFTSVPPAIALTEHTISQKPKLAQLAA
jgi:hypothetical protein